MTRSQRRHHLAAWVVLTPLMLAVLIAALVIRAHAQAKLGSPSSSAGARQ